MSQECASPACQVKREGEALCTWERFGGRLPCAFTRCSNTLLTLPYNCDKLRPSHHFESMLATLEMEHCHAYDLAPSSEPGREAASILDVTSTNAISSGRWGKHFFSRKRTSVFSWSTP